MAHYPYTAIFARIYNRKLAEPVLVRYQLPVLSGEQVQKELEKSLWNNLFTNGKVDLSPSEDYINALKNCAFLFYIYDPDCDADEIDYYQLLCDISEENGFAEIRVETCEEE